MKIREFLPYLVLFLIALAILSPIFSQGFLTKSDSPVHLAEAEYLANNLLKQHHWINGWYPYEFAGFPIQLYSYQLGLIFLSFLILLGITPFFAYKLCILFALFLPASAIYYFLKKYFSYVPALVISIAFLLQKDYTKLILAGMWANLIALALFILIIKLLIDYKFIITKRRALIMGLLFAVLILAHPFFGVAIIYLSIIAFFFSLKQMKNTKQVILSYLLIILTSFLISLFYTYNFISTGSWLNPGSGWGLGKTFSEIVTNLVGIFFSLKPHQQALNYFLQFNPLFFKELILSIFSNLPMLLINLFGILGIIWARKEENKTIMLLLNFTLIYTLISLVIGTGFWFLLDPDKSIPFLNGILAYRFVYYSRLGLFIFAAYSLYRLSGSESKLRIINLIKSKSKLILAIISMLILSGLFLGVYSPPKDYTETFGNRQIHQETLELWSWLKLNLPKDEFRILNQNFFSNINEPLATRDSILPAMAHYYTGLNYFGAWYTTVYPIEQQAQTAYSQLFGRKISEISNEELKENLEIYNIKYAIAISPELKSRLESSGLFIKEQEFQNYIVYNLKDYQPSWIKTPKPIISKLKKFTDQEIVFEIQNPTRQQAVLKFAYHPYWQAYINESEIQIAMNGYKLIEAELPEGEYELTLKYNPKNHPTIIISLMSFIIIVLIIASNKLFKREA